jgi:hypothetical protein
MPGLDGLVVYPVQMNFSDTGTPFIGASCECHDLTGDGIPDLDIKFDKTEIVETFGLTDVEDGTFVELQVSGLIKGETEFASIDCVRIINRK